MRGDFSRIRFNPARGYVAALKQQGRVDTDADANEQRAIDLTLRQTINTDVIGQYGGPENDAGFAITIVDDAIWISPGRYYVNGILVENPCSMSYDQQLHLLGAPAASDLLSQMEGAAIGSTLGLTLQVWQRMVTALDDPCLLEPALQNADTTVRLQTVWRVVGSVNPPAPPATNPGSNNPIAQLSPCCQALYSGLSSGEHSGKMGAELAQGGSDCGCQPIAAAGYQGLENQLYRVEIYAGGDLTSATFKWSRENASVVTQVTQVGTVNAYTITVTSLGPDANLGFQAGQWVELSDDNYQFGPVPNQQGNQSGILYQIASVNQAALQVTMTTPVSGIDTNQNARMRRWDQSGASAPATGIPVSNTPIALENGIQVQFTAGQFQPGDYWTIPARTANGQIDWPPCGGDGNYCQPSGYMQVYQAPLACIGLGLYKKEEILIKGGPGPVSLFQINDCRLLFPPLIDITPETEPAALHVTAVSWTNDDVMTTDMLLENGLSVTFDQATVCPWGGGNFQVSIELPFVNQDLQAFAPRDQSIAGTAQSATGASPGTDYFLRTIYALDPPVGITVSGDQVSWLLPVPSTGDIGNQYWGLLAALNVLLNWANPVGYGRVRVRLIGGAVYGSGTEGNIYLDGESFGQTGTRALDGSECVNYLVPSGNSLNVSDYEGWFYLAPTVYVANVVIQGLVANVQTTVTAITVLVNILNRISGLQITGGTATVTNLEAVITLSYPPIADTKVSLIFNGAGAGSVVSIIASIVIPAGTQSGTAAINILANPGLAPAGGAVIDVVTLAASVATAVVQLPSAVQPTLSISGSAPHVLTPPIPPIIIPPPRT